MNQGRQHITFGRTILLITLPLLLMMANVLWGSLDIPLSAMPDILLGKEIEEHPSWTYIVWQSRVPQMLTATLCGAALATCGLLLQTAFRNPLAGPSILGIDSGASLGVALSMLLFGGSITLGGMSFGGYVFSILAALAGAIGIMVLLSLLNAVLKSTIMLLITGVIISYITGSLISLLQFWAIHDGLQAYGYADDETSGCSASGRPLCTEPWSKNYTHTPHAFTRYRFTLCRHHGFLRPYQLHRTCNTTHCTPCFSLGFAPLPPTLHNGIGRIHCIAL